jgi:transposase-like protein
MSAGEREREIRTLRKQVQYLERQREILKKALSILGEEPNPGMR